MSSSLSPWWRAFNCGHWFVFSLGQIMERPGVDYECFLTPGPRVNLARQPDNTIPPFLPKAKNQPLPEE